MLVDNLSALNFAGWTNQIKKSEMPEGTLDFMDARIFSHIIIPLRNCTGIPMWPSSLVRAHVRHEFGKGAHHTNGKSNLSSGTDWHARDYDKIIKIANHLESMDSVGGIGIYFNTNTPMFHADLMSFRGRRLMWIATNNGKYIYRENNPVLFYIELGNQLNLKGA